MAFRCGQCHPCLVQRGRLWKHRLILEAACHGQSCFMTLTYSDEHIPILNLSDHGVPVQRSTLAPVHLKNFLKRLRKRVDQILPKFRLRFFAVGEYGDKTWRPHYHIIVFGFPGCKRGRTQRDFARNVVTPDSCCDWCRLVSDVWGKGLVELGSVNAESMGYVSGYVLKRLTSCDDLRLRGRNPEFARMSNRPGIGAHFMDAVKRTLDEVGIGKDVPASLLHGGKSFPLNRYLRNRLRVLCGRPEGAPDEVLWEMAQEMRALREGKKISTFEEWKALAVDNITARVSEVESRSKIFNRKVKL